MQFYAAPIVLLFSLTMVGLVGAESRKPVITFVTALWDVKRGDFITSQRSFESYYLRFYGELLETNNNLIAFGDAQLKQFTAAYRQPGNTIFIQKQLAEIEKYWYTPKMWQAIDEFQQHPDRYDWQQMSQMSHFGLRMYNPVVMSKLFFMREALQVDTFDSDYLVWVDGGLTHVFNKSFVERQLIDKVVETYRIDWFFFANKGFFWDKMEQGFRRSGDRYRAQDPLQIEYTNVWANWFGGKVQAVSTVSSIYENLLRITLENKEMNTDESLFSFMMQRYPYLLTKMNTRNPDQFSTFQVGGGGCQEEQTVQRMFNWSLLEGGNGIAQSLAEKPVLILTTGSYEASVYPSLLWTYQKTLYCRSLMALAAVLAYLWLKIGYLHPADSSNGMMAVSSHEDL